MDSLVQSFGFLSTANIGSALSNVGGDPSEANQIGASFKDVLTDVSNNVNVFDSVNSAISLKNPLFSTTTMASDSGNILLSSLGLADLSDPLKNALSQLLGETDAESDSDIQWAGLSLEDSEKLLKIVDLMLYALSDKKPLGEKGGQDIIDELFNVDDDEETKKDPFLVGMTAEMLIQQVVVDSKNYTESNKNANSEMFRQVAGIKVEEDNSADTNSIIIPSLNSEENIAVDETTLQSRLQSISQSLTEKLGGVMGENSINLENDQVMVTVKSFGEADSNFAKALNPAEEELSSFSALGKKENINNVANEISQIFGMRETIPTGELPPADEVNFSSIQTQIERVLQAQMSAELTQTEPVKEVTISLVPEDLGKVVIKITADETGRLSVAISAQNSMTGKLISDNIQSLSSALNRTGTEVSEIIVEASQGADNAGLNLSTGFTDGNSQNFSGGESHQSHRGINVDEIEGTAKKDENINVQGAKLWQMA